MKAVAVLFVAMVAGSQGATLLRYASPLTYSAPAPITTYAAPLAYSAPVAVHSPVVYSAPKVRNVEIPTPVVTKTNLNVVTDADEISTTEIKPAAYGYGYAGYPYIY